jgi:hypothetical protein
LPGERRGRKLVGRTLGAADITPLKIWVAVAGDDFLDSTDIVVTGRHARAALRGPGRAPEKRRGSPVARRLHRLNSAGRTHLPRCAQAA